MATHSNGSPGGGRQDGRRGQYPPNVHGWFTELHEPVGIRVRDGDIIGVVELLLIGPTGQIAGSIVLGADAGLDLCLRIVGMISNARKAQGLYDPKEKS